MILFDNLKNTRCLNVQKLWNGSVACVIHGV